MSKGFIGLDNPNFHGNVRTIRRQGAKSVRRSSDRKAVRTLNDVCESSTASLIKSAVINTVPKQSLSQVSLSPSPQLSVETNSSTAADVKFNNQKNRGFNKTKELSRSQRFERWQRSQLAESKEAVSIKDTQLFIDEDRPNIISFDQFINENQLFDEVTVEGKKDCDLQSVKEEQNSWKIFHKNYFNLKYTLPAMAIILFLIGCGIAVQSVLTNRHVKAQVSNVSNSVGYDPTGKDEVPDETKPDESAGPYIVAPNMPRYIRINKIGVMSRIIRVGVKPNNELIAPNNIHTVGWYEGSALPGEKGTALMDAHVHGPTIPGAFYKIHDLNPGDEIEIEMGDGRKFYYDVAAKESQPYQNVDMTKAMRSIQNGKNGLNLITCGGRYNRDIQMYEERVVVYAVQR